MRQARKRLITVWYVLRGWSVISGVTVHHGDVFLPKSQNLYLADGSHIRNCHISTGAPVILVHKNVPGSNRGDIAAEVQTMRQARRAARSTPDR